IAKSAKDLILILNAKYEFEYIKENAFNELLEYLPKDLIGKKVWDFIHPEDFKRLVEKYELSKDRFQEFKQMDKEELRIRHKNGRYIWLEFISKLYTTKLKENKMLCIGVNISERKKAEKQLKKSEEKYRKAYEQTEFYKDLFAHDMNNILQIINSSSELSALYLNKPEELHNIQELIDIIREQVVRGVKLIANIQKLSNIKESEITLNKLDASKYLEESFNSVYQSFQVQDLSIQVENQNKSNIVYANELLLDVFENILFNAIRHNENKKVEVLIRISKKQQKHKSYLKFEFIDNGIGIDDARKEVIFNRVFKKTKKEGGLGLGLSLVKMIIDIYNGKIWVENKVNGDYTRGSNFIILIPEAN
ncbi:MAG: ATP-binding protein, partial [Candidatus Hermodarchaeota archaeon]